MEANRGILQKMFVPFAVLGKCRMENVFFAVYVMNLTSSFHFDFKILYSW